MIRLRRMNSFNTFDFNYPHRKVNWEGGDIKWRDFTDERKTTNIVNFLNIYDLTWFISRALGSSFIRGDPK